MSGIFDLFSGTGNFAKQQFSTGPIDAGKKSFLTPTSSANVAGTSGKNIGFARPKPKGLSMRSKSDLNVTSFGLNEERSPTKKSPIKGLYLKAEGGRPAGGSRQLSPRGRDKNSKLQVLKSKQLKALSSKTRSPDNVSPCETMQPEASFFRKPFTPKVNVRSMQAYPEPEKLANYYNEETDLHSMTENLDRDFVRLVSLSKPPIKPYEDEGFESDPELIPQPTCEELGDHFKECITAKSPSLPSISDDDDDDDFFL